MKTLAVTATLLTLTMSAAGAQKAAAPVAAKITLLGEVRDSVCDEVSISPNEKLLACATLKPDFRIIDLSTHKTTVLFKGMFAEDLFWSRAGDRIAFSGGEEGSDEWHAWAVGVDPRTGQQTSAPRRLSAATGGLPAFSPDGQLVPPPFVALLPVANTGIALGVVFDMVMKPTSAPVALGVIVLGAAVSIGLARRKSASVAQSRALQQVP